MSRLHEWLASIEAQRYNGANARARLCQDIVLEAISKGKLSRHVTIKGGVVMRSLTGDIRRATQDMDIDFIRYSLADEAIQKFIDDINIKVKMQATLTFACMNLKKLAIWKHRKRLQKPSV